MTTERKPMWVPYVDPAEAQGEVAYLYDQVRRERGGREVPATALVFSLRPKAGMAKEALRNVVLDDNTLGGRRTELINIAVSGMNACSF